MKKISGACFLGALWLMGPFCASAQPPSPPPKPTVSVRTPAQEDMPAFQQMLIHVYQQNPRLQSARQALKAQDERVSEAVAGFRPTLSATGDLGRQRVATGGQDWIYGTARDEALIVNQTLFNGFGTAAQFHAARARVSAERAHLVATEEQVFFDAISAYMEVVTRKYMVMFYRENRSHLYSYVEAAEKKLKGGDGTRTDLAQAESRFAQADASVATAEAAWHAACATYQRATGLPVTAMDFPPLPDRLPTSAEDAAVLARQAPEFTEAAEQERAAKHDVDSASSSLWPTLSLRGSMSDQLSPTLGLENLRDDSVTLNLSIPLYEGGGDYARIREAKELHEKAHDDLTDISRVMTERATQAWYNYHGATLVIEASRRTAEAAYRALNGAEAELRQGMRTMQDTLDTRAEFVNALNAEVQAEENARLQAYRLLAATGQLTAEALHLDTALYNPRAHYDKVEGAWAGLKQQ